LYRVGVDAVQPLVDLASKLGSRLINFSRSSAASWLRCSRPDSALFFGGLPICTAFVAVDRYGLQDADPMLIQEGVDQLASVCGAKGFHGALRTLTGFGYCS